MAKKVKVRLLLSIIVVLLFLAFPVYSAVKEDHKEMREAVYAIDHPEMDIVHTELLDEQTGLVFYEHMIAGKKYFGEAVVVKNWLGWHLARSGSGQIPEDYAFMRGFSNLEQLDGPYTDLLGGKILDPRVEEVIVVTDSGETYETKIVEYNNREKFWFLISKKRNLFGVTVKGLSEEGEVLEKIPDI